MPNRFDDLGVLGLSELDLDDRTYAISPRWFPLGLLASSIKKTGILSPLHVEPGNRGQYRIVCGFRRAQAAGDAGLKSLPCWVRKNRARADLFVESILDNVGSRPLHELEKASAVYKLAREFSMSHEKMLEEFLPLLEIRPTSFHLRRYLEIDRLPEQLKKATVLSRLEIDTALAIREWTEEEQALFLNLHTRYRLNVNTQKKLAELLDELRRKSTLSPIELWRQAVGDTEPGSEAPSAAEFETVYRSLHRLRMPRLSSLEERFRELKSALRLPPEIRVQPPQYFEGERITVFFSASSAREFREAADRLRTASKTTEMEKIFELL